MNEDILNGEIVYVRSDEYLVDIGTGADVSLPFSEAINEYKVGDKVDVSVIDVVKGEKIVSEKKIAKLKLHLNMENLIGSEDTVEGKIVGFNKGQFLVELSDGIGGLCYIKHLESFFIDNGEDYIGKIYDFHVIGIKGGRPVKFELSREKIIQKERDELTEKFANTFVIDEIVSGTITKHLNSGVIAEHGEFECFIPKSEISYSIADPSPEIGETVDFKIIRLEKEKLNVVGSMKVLQNDPWDQIAQYNTTDRYEAPINRVEKYGVFVELGENLSGLIHVSELSHDFIDDTSAYNVGDIQEFKVLNINNDDRKISLSTKALYPSKYVLAKDEFTVGEHLVLPVSKFYRSGIFVKLMDKYDVFVKNEEIYNHTQVRPTLKIGSRLDFVILDFDDEREEVKLSNQAYVAKEVEIFEKALAE